MITLKANNVVGLIRANFKHITPEMLKILYTSLVLPILEYGSCMWFLPLFIVNAKSREYIILLALSHN